MYIYIYVYKCMCIYIYICVCIYIMDILDNTAYMIYWIHWIYLKVAQIRGNFREKEDRSQSEFGSSPTRKLRRCRSIGHHMFHCVAAWVTQTHPCKGAFKWLQKTCQNMFQYPFSLLLDVPKSSTRHFLSLQVCMCFQCSTVLVHLFISSTFTPLCHFYPRSQNLESFPKPTMSLSM